MDTEKFRSLTFGFVEFILPCNKINILISFQLDEKPRLLEIACNENLYAALSLK